MSKLVNTQFSAQFQASDRTGTQMGVHEAHAPLGRVECRASRIERGCRTGVEVAASRDRFPLFDRRWTGRPPNVRTKVRCACDFPWYILFGRHTLSDLAITAGHDDKVGAVFLAALQRDVREETLRVGWRTGASTDMSDN